MSSIQFGRYIVVGNRDQYKDHIKGASTYAILYDIGLLSQDDASAACLAPNALVSPWDNVGGKKYMLMFRFALR